MKTQRKQNHKRDARIERRRSRRNYFDLSAENASSKPFYEKKQIAPLRALTEAQGHYLTAIDSNIITIGIGPAGTGKTYLAGAYAADLLRNGDIEKIIITRPLVEAGEKIGTLPGELDDKYKPFIEPFIDVLEERLGKSQVKYFMSHGQIVASPMSFMRGKSFKNCLVILDEAQNATPVQMKLFLTRIGENCKVIVDGDIEQKDIYGKSGLLDAVERLNKVPAVRVVRFGIEDIVRSGIVRDIIEAYQD